MKSTGIVRRVDEVGRIVLPRETRTVLGIDIRDPLVIFTDGDAIILQKYHPGCLFCNEAETVDFKGQKIFRNCLEELKKL